MIKYINSIVLLALMIVSSAAAPKVILPFEKADNFKPFNEIDTLVMAELKKQGVKPANLCSDAVFIRRVYLDVLGILPSVREVKKFLANKAPDKRARLIDFLLSQNENFANYWSLKWGDILRVKAEFPINLWPNAVQAYSRWIYDALKNNMAYDRFARELLTSSGSNFRTPQVNFYRALQGKKTSSIAAAVALTFMGSRYAEWPKEKQAEMAVFFSRVAYKGTAEWKEEIVYLDPKPSPPLEAVFPDGSSVVISPEQDPRVIFANWLISPKNPWFKRNIVNRVWSWLLGRGIIHEPDDIRAAKPPPRSFWSFLPGRRVNHIDAGRKKNPPSHPELLAYLEKELVKSGYNLKHIYRLILNSRTYQQSPIPRDQSPKATALFACYPVRQLDAEALIDALNSITGKSESYESPIPEPFTFVPTFNSSKSLADGSITSQFLEMFGRPPRDTGLESERNNRPSEPQRLHMLNSTHIQNKLDGAQRLWSMMRKLKWRQREIINMLYLNILSRYPTKDEIKTIGDYLKTRQVKYQDVVWALVNSKEFLCRH